VSNRVVRIFAFHDSRLVDELRALTDVAHEQTGGSYVGVALTGARAGEWVEVAIVPEAEAAAIGATLREIDALPEREGPAA
jgi:hypothetical protein